ncbi:MAG: hypothetical protein HY698_20970, partial [Deltaproteobacteria bacterium]|nr:hypothetical protein [Deltaproteobacteria bacterium]
MIRLAFRAVLSLLLVLVAAVSPVALAQDKPKNQDLEKLLKSTDEIAAKVSSLRGLPIKKKIAR